MTYNIYTKALEILKKRENYYGFQMGNFDKAAAYNSAWWILKYAIEENWDALDQFDYYDEPQDEPFDDCDNDTGYDPYLGCITDDC